MDYTGPLWTGPIADQAFVERIIAESQTTMLKTKNRINKLLNQIKDEATAPITYYVIDKLSGKDDLPAPSNKAFIDALKKAGYQAVPTHFNPRGIKTDASATAMHKILKELTTATDALTSAS
jgi:tRNA (guanine26-N2/guanine27-N2)-dimethyltransferase